jgi:membrane protease YdiL (CAAX protease family)
MVFRGYGFETVREALGQPAALGVLIPAFALYHGLDPQQALGMAAGGTALMLLRLQSDALWLPLGYHWAWNVFQTHSPLRHSPRYLVISSCIAESASDSSSRSIAAWFC